jgi:hypothetical protein
MVVLALFRRDDGFV